MATSLLSGRIEPRKRNHKSITFYDPGQLLGPPPQKSPPRRPNHLVGFSAPLYGSFLIADQPGGLRTPADPVSQRKGAGVLKWISLTLMSLWAWFVFGLTTFILIPVMVVLYAFTARTDPGRYRVGRVFRMIGVMTFRFNPLWSARVSGVKIANPRNPYVVVSNHESFADILLLCHVPWEMKWMSKIEIFRIPVLGFMMRLAGDIPLDRGSRESAGRAMELCRQMLRNHVSVMIFPEGTRSTGEELLPFKDGAFRLAIKTGVPILPLAIVGTRNALAKHDWRFGRSDAEVRVLAPIEVTGLSLKDTEALKQRVRSSIEAARSDMLQGNGHPQHLQIVGSDSS
jgi:1-acyl-sn-glycerol-3-phosphate acyltransferase